MKLHEIAIPAVTSVIEEGKKRKKKKSKGRRKERVYNGFRTAVAVGGGWGGWWGGFAPVAPGDNSGEGDGGSDE